MISILIQMLYICIVNKIFINTKVKQFTDGCNNRQKN